MRQAPTLLVYDKLAVKQRLRLPATGSWTDLDSCKTEAQKAEQKQGGEITRKNMYMGSDLYICCINNVALHYHNYETIQALFCNLQMAHHALSMVTEYV